MQKEKKAENEEHQNLCLHQKQRIFGEADYENSEGSRQGEKEGVQLKSRRRDLICTIQGYDPKKEVVFLADASSSCETICRMESTDSFLTGELTPVQQ